MSTSLNERHKNVGPVSMNIFWDWDKIAPYPMTVRLRVDHEINGEELCRAFDEALSVWPLLKDSFVEEDDGNIYFVENKNPIKVHHTESVIAAGQGPNDNRVIALSYYKDIMTFTGLHSFLDGGSLFMVMRVTICRYFQIHYKKDFEVGILPKAGEGNKPENYEFYTLRKDISEQTYERKEPIWCTPDCFIDPRTKAQEGTPLVLSRIEIEGEDFISYCKKYGSNPSVMLVLLMAQTIYKLNPNEERAFTGLITMNVRKAIGIDMAIMGQSTAMMLELSKDEIANSPLTELVKKNRVLMDAQRSRDYLLSRADDMRNCRPFMQDKYSLRLSYFGDFNYGECTPFIKSILTYNEAYDEVHMFSLNGTFYIDIECGTVSEEYAKAVAEVLGEAGVSAKVSNTYDKLPKVVR